MQKQPCLRSLVVRGRLFAAGWIFLLAAAAVAQTPPAPNSGVAVGGVHLIVQDPAQFRKLLIDIFGATVAQNGSMELVKLPGMYIALEKGEATGGSGDSAINHFGVWIKDYDEAKAKIVAARLEFVSDNYKAAECAVSPGTPACQMTVTFPSGVRIEFTEDKKLATTSAFHHIHMMVTEPEITRDWYAKVFGGTPYLRRGTIVAALLDRGEVDFNKSKQTQAPTKGRAIDRFGLEVKGLEAFCKKLEAAGIKLDKPPHAAPGANYKHAFITDPVGARIELTEGLAAN